MAVSSLVLYALDLAKTAEFYRSIGVHLDQNDERALGQVGKVRIVILRAASNEMAPTGSVGTTMIGFEVPDVAGVVRQLQNAGRRVLRPVQDLDWGRRGVVADPDGRPVELVERADS